MLRGPERSEGHVSRNDRVGQHQHDFGLAAPGLIRRYPTRKLVDKLQKHLKKDAVTRFPVKARNIIRHCLNVCPWRNSGNLAPTSAKVRWLLAMRTDVDSPIRAALRKVSIC